MTPDPGLVPAVAITLWHAPVLGAARTAAWVWPAEESRALTYRHTADADRFRTGRALVRAAVGSLTGAGPEELEVRVQPRGSRDPGRPVVVGGPPVSIAHAGDRVLVAVVAVAPPPAPTGDTAGLQVGVDLEPAAAAAGRLEDLLDAVAPAERPATGWTDLAFVRTWVRREAVLKAVGTGLLAPREDLTLSAGDLPPAVLRTAGLLPPRDQLHLLDVDLAPLGDAWLGALALWSPGGGPAPQLHLADGLELLEEQERRTRHR